MRQVPRYLIIGNGRVARHFAYYFILLHIPFVQWHRSMPIEELQSTLPHVTHVLLLIRDDAIESFAYTHLIGCTATLVHFSGSLVIDTVYGAHPLMSFGPALYSLEEYQTIPFVIDATAPSFETLLPGLVNQSVRLAAEKKAKYHALCVLSGNFSCLLWQKIFADFEKEFNIPSSVVHPYLKKQMHNIMLDYQKALTGPLVRNDKNTIDRNLVALENDPYQKLYQAFVDCYEELTHEYL